MEKRLISQNILQCSNQLCPQFSAYGSFIAYKTSNTIKIKSFHKQIDQIQLKISKQIIKHFLTSYNNRLFCCIEYIENNIEIYEIELIGLQLQNKVYKTLTNSKNPVHLKHGIAYICQNNVVKLLTLQNNNEINICQCPLNSTIIQHEGDDIFILCTHQQQENNHTKILKIYHPTSNSFIFQQSALHIDYINNPLAVYKDHFIFQFNKEKKEIQIFNISLSKLVGKLLYQGEFIRSFLRGNLLLTIMNKQNMDKYCFYTLNTDPNAKNLLSHRCQYQKGKGMYFQVFNCTEDVSEQITQGKSTQLTYDDYTTQSTGLINDLSVLIIYVLPVKKTKIEIIKLPKSKIKQQTFKQHQADMIILSKGQNKQKWTSQKKIKIENQQLEIQKIRINSSMNHKKNQKSFQDMHKKFIDHIVDIKIKGLIDKFDQLQKRLTRIQDQIVIIYAKIQKSLSNINKQEIKKNVENLFERVTPQFQSYFKQVFKQISGVLDQGVTYYKTKLSKQQKIHRQTLQDIINITFNATQQIIQLSQTQINNQQKISANLDKLAEIRKKWQYQTDQLPQIFAINQRTKNDSSTTYDITLMSSATGEKEIKYNESRKKKQ